MVSFLFCENMKRAAGHIPLWESEAAGPPPTILEGLQQELEDEEAEEIGGFHEHLHAEPSIVGKAALNPNGGEVHDFDTFGEFLNLQTSGHGKGYFQGLTGFHIKEVIGKRGVHPWQLDPGKTAVTTGGDGEGGRVAMTGQAGCERGFWKRGVFIGDQ